jgi:hypothetical protein
LIREKEKTSKFCTCGELVIGTNGQRERGRKVGWREKDREKDREKEREKERERRGRSTTETAANLFAIVA